MEPVAAAIAAGHGGGHQILWIRAPCVPAGDAGAHGAGGVIHPHVDANPAALWPHKIHVPITTNEKVTFFIGDEGHKLEVGKAYEVNNLGMHAVTNEGESDRIHLIFEYYDLDQPED